MPRSDHLLAGLFILWCLISAGLIVHRLVRAVLDRRRRMQRWQRRARMEGRKDPPGFPLD